MVRLSYHKSYKYLIRLDGVQTQPPPNVKGERQKREYGYHMTNIHPEEITQCSFCNYRLFVKNETTERRLTVHINQKHAKKNEAEEFLCSLCSEPFKVKQTLLTHVRIHHFQYQPFKCESCDYVSDTTFKLYFHKRNRHPSGDTKYLCDKCDSIFNTTGKAIGKNYALEKKDKFLPKYRIVYQY